MLAVDPFELCRQRGERPAGTFVLRIGLELDPAKSQLLERVPQQQVLRFDVGARVPRRRVIPRVPDLDPEMLVIADARLPVALAGIMGGEQSEISERTTDVLIESAYFDPDSVRRTARQLGMDTEASRRFERGADCENVLRAQTRCIELICEIAGGVATENAVDIYPSPVTRRSVDFRPARVEGLTSLKVELSEMNRILGGLGFVRNTDSEDKLNFTAPSWRVDIALEEDLVEEIARHTGYEKIRSELPPSNMAGEYQPAEMKRRELRRALKASGFDEAVNFSFIETGHDEEFETIPAFASDGRRQAFVSLRNPILEEAVRMRPTLLPGLLKAVRHNLNQGLRDVRLFEIGRIFTGSEAHELPQEREALGLVATGAASEEGRAQAPRELDLYDLKGSLEAAIEVTNLGPIQFSKGTIKHLREGQAAIMKLADGTTIGTITPLLTPDGHPFLPSVVDILKTSSGKKPGLVDRYPCLPHRCFSYSHFDRQRDLFTCACFDRRNRPNRRHGLGRFD